MVSTMVFKDLYAQTMFTSDLRQISGLSDADGIHVISYWPTVAETCDSRYIISIPAVK